MFIQSALVFTPTLTKMHINSRDASHRGKTPDWSGSEDTLLAWAPDTDDDDDEKPPHQHTTACSHNWDYLEDWEGLQTAQRFWTPWAQDALEPPTQTIRFQQTIEGRPLKREPQSSLMRPPERISCILELEVTNKS